MGYKQAFYSKKKQQHCSLGSFTKMMKFTVKCEDNNSLARQKIKHA